VGGFGGVHLPSEKTVSSYIPVAAFPVIAIFVSHEVTNKAQWIPAAD